MKKTVLLVLLLAAGLYAQKIYATFDVEAARSAELSVSASGIIEAINVDVGSRVKKGDVLLWLGNRDLKEALELAKSRLELARINAKYAERDFRRFEKVKKVIDEGVYDQYASAYERSLSSVREAEVNVRYKEELLNKTILRAPFDGVIYDKPVEVGDVVSGAMIKILLRLQSTEDAKLKLAVDQKYWKQLKAGQSFTYRVDGDATLRKGVIDKVYPTANSGNRKIIVEVPAKRIIPGLFGDGEIEAE
jgi:membrane fusion protein (multidrug efflux system)